MCVCVSFFKEGGLSLRVKQGLWGVCMCVFGCVCLGVGIYI